MSDRKRRKLRRTIFFILQAIVTVTLLWWLIRDEKFRDRVWEVILNADPVWLGIGLLWGGLGTYLSVFRWQIYLRALEIPMTHWGAVRLTFIGTLFNQIFLGSVGGDAVKVGYLIAHGESKSKSLMSAILDRLSGFGALLLASVIFIWLRFDWLMQSTTVRATIWFVGIYLGAIFLVLVLSFLLAGSGLTRKLPEKVPMRKWFIEFSEAYYVFVQHWRGTLLATGISCGILLSYYMTFYSAAQGFNADIGMLDFFAIMPAVDIISSLPISLGGLGVRENLFVVMLRDLCGTPHSEAVLISLTGFLFTAAWGLLGAVFLLTYRSKDKEISPLKAHELAE